MADVKWIKISTDIFDNRKIRQILKMPNGDKMTNIWFRLLCMTGISNNHGFITLTDDIPYTVDMLAAEFCEDLEIVQTAINIFQRFGMIGQENGRFYVNNWEEYQNIDGMERIKEQNRERKRKERENKKNDVSRDSHVTVTQQDIDKDIDKDIDTDKRHRNKDSDKFTYQLIVDMYNDTCVSFPRLTTLSQARKKAIKARLKVYTVEDFQTLFLKAETSRFLKGENSKDWYATFDWLIKDANMAKVLDGNYDDRFNKNKTAQRLDDLQDMSFAWAEREDGK